MEGEGSFKVVMPNESKSGAIGPTEDYTVSERRHTSPKDGHGEGIIKRCLPQKRAGSS